MKITLKSVFESITTIRIFTAILSLSLSIFANHFNVILNADGILYIYTIDALKAGGITAAESLYNWPFFSILSAWLSNITGWSTEFSVKALNTVLFMLLTDAMVLLSSKSLPNLRQVAIASVLIISFYTLNNYRDFIIRDIGYWAFACFSLYQFSLFLENKNIKNAVLWQILIIIALLFRIEAIVLLALVPFYVLFTNKFQNKWLAFLHSYSVSIVSFITIGFVTLFNPEITNSFSKLYEILTYFDPSLLLAEIKSGTEILEKEILHPAADEHATRILVFGLILTVFWELFAGISIFYLILLVMACFYWKRLLSCRQQNFYIFILFINILILSTFAIKSQLITTRYCVLGLLFLLLILLPSLTAYISEKIDLKQKNILLFISFLIIISLSDTLVSTKNKTHIKTVSTWAAQNLPVTAKILTTDFRVEYYFNEARNNGSKIEFITNPNNINQYDYLLQYKKNDDVSFLNKNNGLEFVLIKEKGNDDNRVSVYAINP